MKIFNAQQIKELDAYTIEHEPIRSIDLMERAATAITSTITKLWTTSMKVIVFAGPGNNGGDALAVARMLAERNYEVTAFLFNIHHNLTEECSINRNKLECVENVQFHEVHAEFNIPQLEKNTLVVDGLFGAGISRPLTGGFSSLVKLINQSPAEVVSIDIPSGLMTEDNSFNVRSNIVKADVTITLHQKKLSFYFPENQQYLGKIIKIDIGLSKEGIKSIPAQYQTLERRHVAKLLQPRSPFLHKGNAGHALLIVGSYGLAGAAILSAKACLRSGVGKLAVKTPKKNVPIMQIAVPEAIMLADNHDNYFSEAVDVSDYDAIGIGSGIGIQEQTAIAMVTQLRRSQVPAVVDADAINILSSHNAWLQNLPQGLIFTPHPKEMDRLTDNTHSDSYERLSSARDFAMRHHHYVILKGHYSMLCTPEGKVYINTTGNAGMATAGSGDVLTGIITALVARGYNQEHACILGMYLHGLAGDYAAQDKGQESLIASDIIDYLPNAFKALQE